MTRCTIFQPYLQSGMKDVWKRIFFPLVIVMLFCINGFSQNVGNIVVNSSTTVVNQGQSFSVKLRVVMISGSIDAAEVHLDFDKTKLSVTSVAPTAGNPLGLTLLALD